MRGSVKQWILRAVSRSAARLLLIHVFVLNKGRDPFKWHHNGLHEWPRGGWDRIESPFVAMESDSRSPNQWEDG